MGQVRGRAGAGRSITRRARLVLACTATMVAGAAHAAGASAAEPLLAGAGRADITPPTGYYMAGWVHVDAKATGQHTRLFARSLVLQRGERKLALVAVDLAFVDQALTRDVARAVADRGFTEQDVLISASHTHGAYEWGNFAFMTRSKPTEVGLEPDPQLYSFEVRRIAEAIRRADDDRAPAAIAWGEERLLGVTDNRSLEAHLANHGIEKAYGEGRVADDPDGPSHTIAPEVHVLRVDKLGSTGTVPIGVWSTFAAHGTVNKATFTVMNADHHGAATRVVEQELAEQAAAAGVPGQEIVNAFGNTDEGDVSAGLHRGGPAASEYVGRREASAMLRGWRTAGERLDPEAPLDWRWTRICFCGQETEGGRVDDHSVMGFPFLTGSEEGRGPLYENTQTPHEGIRKPFGHGPQSRKIGIDSDPAGLQATGTVTPLMAVRAGDRVIVTVPGEMTAEMGRRVREATLAATRGHGISRTVISGLVNDYKNYFVTPEEFDAQHYEGGSTVFGKFSSNLIKQELSDLAARLVRGAPAQEPVQRQPGQPETDPTPFGLGADGGRALDQPGDAARLERPSFTWQGAPRGLDRPLDRAFVTVERRTADGWAHQDDDLGLRILWRVDDEGRYTARWEAPLDAPAGRYRFRVTANRYALASEPFALAPSRAVSVGAESDDDARTVLRLHYPEAEENVDLTWRPRHARGGEITLRADGQTVTLVADEEGRFVVPDDVDGPLHVAAGGARDEHGNTNAEAVTFG